MSFYFELSSPWNWVSTDRRGRTENHGQASSLAELPLPGDPSTAVYGVVPGEAVVVRHATIPSRNRKKVLAAVPYALEEMLSDDVDDLHFALLRWQPGEGADVAVVSREHMQDWMELLEQAGVRVTGLVPDYMLVPRHPQAQYILLRDDRGRLLLREQDRAGLVMDEDMLPLWWQGVAHVDPAVAVDDEALGQVLIELGATRVSQWSVGGNLAAWLEQGEPRDPEHLLQGEFAVKRSSASTRRLWPAAAMVALAVAGRIGMDAYEYWRLASENRQLDRRIESVFRTTFPDATRVVNPRLQMQQRVAALKSGYAGSGDLPVLLATTARVLPSAQAVLQEFDFRDNALVFNCTVNDFAALERLKGQFEAQPGLVTELQSSGAQDQKVSARFRLRRVAG